MLRINRVDLFVRPSEDPIQLGDFVLYGRLEYIVFGGIRILNHHGLEWWDVFLGGIRRQTQQSSHLKTA